MYRVARRIITELTEPPLPCGSATATHESGELVGSGSDIKYVVVSPKGSMVRALTSGLGPSVPENFDSFVQVGEQVPHGWSGQIILAALIGSGPSHRPTTANITDNTLADLLEELIKLRTAHDEDELYVASEFAYWNAVRLLSAAYGLLMVTTSSYFHLPRPTLSADSEGGLRCRWCRNGREIRINFAGRPELRSYIYYEQEPAYALEELTADNVAARLRWLLEE